MACSCAGGAGEGLGSGSDADGTTARHRVAGGGHRVSGLCDGSGSGAANSAAAGDGAGLGPAGAGPGIAGDGAACSSATASAADTATGRGDTGAGAGVGVSGFASRCTGCCHGRGAGHCFACARQGSSRDGDGCARCSARGSAVSSSNAACHAGAGQSVSCLSGTAAGSRAATCNCGTAAGRRPCHGAGARDATKCSGVREGGLRSGRTRHARGHATAGGCRCVSHRDHSRRCADCATMTGAAQCDAIACTSGSLRGFRGRCSCSTDGLTHGDARDRVRRSMRCKRCAFCGAGRSATYKSTAACNAAASVCGTGIS